MAMNPCLLCGGQLEEKKEWAPSGFRHGTGVFACQQCNLMYDEAPPPLTDNIPLIPGSILMRLKLLERKA